MVGMWLRCSTRAQPPPIGRIDHDEIGASLVEYALLIALIAVVCIVAVTTLGSNASAKFSSVGSSLS